MLELNGITKNFEGKKAVLRDINCRLNQGYIYGLIGVNGAGKTTLLRIIARLLRKHGGQILFSGKDITNADAKNLPFRFVSDTPCFFPDLTAIEQMLFVCRSRGLSKQEANQQIEHYVDLLSLSDYSKSFPRTMSRGTQQRLNIALSFMGCSQLNMYDEPFITLDPIQVLNVEEAILHKKRTDGLIQIISSHNLDSLEKICDKYLIIHNCSVIEFDSGALGRQAILELLDEPSIALP